MELDVYQQLGAPSDRFEDADSAGLTAALLGLAGGKWITSDSVQEGHA